MFRKLFPCMLAVAVVFLTLTRAEPQVTKPLITKPQQPPAGGKVVPKLEPIAETKLLMEGLAHANFRGLDRILAKKPDEAQAWTFARGQALLLAETANLLMLRPPRNQGQPAWFERAMELRSVSTQLAQTLSKQDYEGGRSGLVKLANACNRCHQTFRVAVEIAPFKEMGGE
jgi:hypothetical protein